MEHKACVGLHVAAGPLTAAAMCQAVAALQPPGTILVDESLTSGTAYWEASKVGSLPTWGFTCQGQDALCIFWGTVDLLNTGLIAVVPRAVPGPDRKGFSSQLV